MKRKKQILSLLVTIGPVIVLEINYILVPGIIKNPPTIEGVLIGAGVTLGVMVWSLTFFYGLTGLWFWSPWMRKKTK